MSNVMYSTDGAGHWALTTWKPQCESTVFIHNRCQGVAGHAGEHWAYAEDGTYLWHDNADAPGSLRYKSNDPFRGVAGSIPPGSAEYVDPRQMAPICHLACHETIDVTDHDELTRLETAWQAGECIEGASMTGPCSSADVF